MCVLKGRTLEVLEESFVSRAREKKICWRLFWSKKGKKIRIVKLTGNSVKALDAHRFQKVSAENLLVDDSGEKRDQCAMVLKSVNHPDGGVPETNTAFSFAPHEKVAHKQTNKPHRNINMLP